MIEATIKCDNCGKTEPTEVFHAVTDMNGGPEVLTVLATKGGWRAGWISDEKVDLCSDLCLQEMVTKKQATVTLISRDGEETEIKPAAIH